MLSVTCASALAKLQDALLEIESRLALVDSLTPINFEAEVERLTGGLSSGSHFELAFRYRRAEALAQRADDISARLSATQVALGHGGFLSEVPDALASLLEGRVRELCDEVALLRARGTPEVTRLAKKRFAFSDQELNQAGRQAQEWLRSGVEEDTPSQVTLLPFLAQRSRALGDAALGMRVVERPIVGKAAVSGENLYVRPGAQATRTEAERLWVHEAHGHLLPRLRSRTSVPPLGIGTPGCVEDEEGWAVYLEKERGLLGGRRKRQLAARFLLAEAFRTGGECAALERARELVCADWEAGEVARCLCRVARGGGLCREVVYLPAFLRVSLALAEHPEWVSVFEQGRASVAGCDVLAELVR